LIITGVGSLIHLYAEARTCGDDARRRWRFPPVFFALPEPVLLRDCSCSSWARASHPLRRMGKGWGSAATCFIGFWYSDQANAAARQEGGSSPTASATFGLPRSAMAASCSITRTRSNLWASTAASAVSSRRSTSLAARFRGFRVPAFPGSSTRPTRVDAGHRPLVAPRASGIPRVAPRARARRSRLYSVAYPTPWPAPTPVSALIPRRPPMVTAGV